MKYASKIVTQAQAWLGCKESDGTHKPIIDIYNSHRPLARGVKMDYGWAWCAAFVSACAIKQGYTDIIPTECSCTRMIELFKGLGAWVENENRTPAPGDILFYDWDDNGVGDNKGNPEHVGIVEKVSGGKITVIEGNYSNAVMRRVLSVNGRYIRGYGVPKYDAESAPAVENKEVCSVNLRELSKGSKGNDVRALQILLIGTEPGYSCGSYGADGDFGSATDSAVRKFQSANRLVVDGIVGSKTWGKLLGVK